MDVDDLPDEYWIIQCATSFFRVDGATADRVAEAMNTLDPAKRYGTISFTDLSGDIARPVFDSINEIYSSSSESRAKTRLWDAKLAAEVKPWE